MKKRASFLPSLNQTGEFNRVSSMDKGDDYRDHRVREALIHPMKVKDFSRKFNLNSTCGGDSFIKEAGREIDLFDPGLSKYYNCSERGIKKPIPDENGKTFFTQKSELTWSPPKFAPNLIET
jgi:hypothetical protein